jgi:aryl-alcohol dehydrogenase-like predicted oxidoreductase
MQEAARLIDICLEAGVNFLDTADVYSDGASKAFWAQGSRDAPMR